MKQRQFYWMRITGLRITFGIVEQNNNNYYVSINLILQLMCYCRSLGELQKKPRELYIEQAEEIVNVVLHRTSKTKLYNVIYYYLADHLFVTMLSNKCMDAFTQPQNGCVLASYLESHCNCHLSMHGPRFSGCIRAIHRDVKCMEL